MTALMSFVDNDLEQDILNFRYKLDLKSDLYYPLDISPSLVTRKTWGYELINIEKSTNQYLVKWLVFTKVGAHSSLHYHIKKNEFFSVMFSDQNTYLHNYNLEKNEWSIGMALTMGDEIFTPSGLPHMITIGQTDSYYTSAAEGSGGHLILLEVAFFAEKFSSFKELLEADKEDNVKLFPAGEMTPEVFGLPKLDISKSAPKQNKPDLTEDHGDDLLV